MAAAPIRSVLEHLRRVLGRPGGEAVTDADLLERFISARDEAAFELLVWRHQQMVLNVCRRVLRDGADAEDAFQATFLVLVRRAGSIARREAVSGWLYRVAYRIAMKARARNARRAAREQLAADLSVVERPGSNSAERIWHELQPLLDPELIRLPEKYRLPVVLCYLEGRTYEEAAQQLGWAKGTVSTRLTRARELLRQRLGRRGLALSPAVLAGALVQHSASAAVPAALVESTVRAATLLAAAGTLSGSVTPQVLALVEATVRRMLISRALTLAGLVVCTGMFVVGGLWLASALMPARGMRPGGAGGSVGSGRASRTAAFTPVTRTRAGQHQPDRT
jgi:RNA polymerase sigma factor (sigma-70 family)